MLNFISLRGCRLHNLKNVDAQFPLGKITVVCGPSGCGKSTLVMDTLHGESKRRYLETLSPFAADMLGGKRSIPLDSAEGLPASLAISATRGEAPAKAYALSIAECDNALRTLFAAFAKPACPVCGAPMVSHSREEIIRIIAGKPVGTKLQFLAKIDPCGHTLDKLSAAFLAQGFTRALADGTMYSLADLLPSEKVLKPKEFFIIVDRIIVRENTRTRIAEAVDATLKLTHSAITLDIGGEREFYSTKPCCPNAGDKDHEASDAEAVTNLDARSFSPYCRTSVCEYCDGTGIILNESTTKSKGNAGKSDAKTKENSRKNEANEAFDDDDESDECPHCHGLRLKKTYLNATIDGVSYKQILTTEFAELPKILHQIFDDKIGQNLRATFTSLLDRLEAINDLGIGYLTPGRAGKTLSGGEIQRLKLASLSTGHLNGLLIALDEPASGLHASDVKSLWTVLEKVRKRGNTLVLIEHNPQIISRADYIIEMGPGAGEKGGEVLFQGPRDEVLENPESPTGRWIKELDDKCVGRASRASLLAHDRDQHLVLERSESTKTSEGDSGSEAGMTNKTNATADSLLTDMAESQSHAQSAMTNKTNDERAEMDSIAPLQSDNAGVQHPKKLESGKMQMLLDLLTSIQDQGEKTLIFTQFAEMGNLLKTTIETELGLRTHFYHGGCTQAQRAEMIQDFQGNPDCKVLILSLKAGGTGLNLTAASQVIHYDLWWNPAIEAQATDRAFRIGQKRNVQVHRFITKGTFEEKINALLETKKAIANMTVNAGETWLADMDDKQLAEIFRLDNTIV